MLKKHIYIAITFLALTACAQNKATLYSKQRKIYPRINIPTTANTLLSNVAKKFNENFKKLTGQYLKIERSNSLNNNYNYIILRVNPTQKENYCFYKKDKNITIQGVNTQNLLFGINHFFKQFTTLKLNKKKHKITHQTINGDIEIPLSFRHCSAPDFDYREPYFSSNFDPEFRARNKTNYLELEWGLWGHNLKKILKKYNLPETSYAKVGNKRIKSQYCFTSDSLYTYLYKEIGNIYANDNTLDKYMVLPNDNNIVCTCANCKLVGNTKNDAAPSVFNFLNRLAENYKELSFFTTAYATVKEIPQFKAASNVGIFYSTIDIQKGIPIQDSKYLNQFETDIKKWKKYVNNLFIWDYSVNFDNYFDIYPSLKVIQKNLKLYKKLGINGVFMHGSEYDYSTFQELKAKIIAKLLWNSDVNVDDEIRSYFYEKYPKKLAEDLTSYYSFLENSFIENKKELHIYSGIKKSIEKYLDPKMFFNFYKEFELNAEKYKNDKDFLKIITALTFLKLEIMRDFGLGNYGFATINNNNEIIVKNEATILLDKLSMFSKSSNLKNYNESRFQIEEYIKNWRKKIDKYHKRKHYFCKKPFHVLSKLDEDYTNTKLLNNGTFGFLDYNTNWHISSIDNLTLKIEKKFIEQSRKITFSFLQDTKHSIYYPSSIEILDLNSNIIKTLKLPADKTSLATKEISIALPTEFDKKQLSDIFILKINKNNIKGKNALACDEIIFN